MNVLWPEKSKVPALDEVISEALETLGLEIGEFFLEQYACVLIRPDDIPTYAGKILLIYDFEGNVRAVARVIFGQYVSFISGLDQANRLSRQVQELKEASAKHQSNTNLFRPVVLLAPHANVFTLALSKETYRNIVFILGRPDIEKGVREPFLQTSDEFKAWFDQALRVRLAAYEQALASRPDGVRGLPT